YLWRGPRRPRWDLRFQLQRDIAYRFIRHAMPQRTDDSDIDSLDIPAIMHGVRAKAMPAAVLAVEDGEYQAIGIPARQALIGESEFGAAGVGADRLRELWRQDQERERQIGCELVVAADVAKQLDADARLACRPAAADEKVVLFLHGGGYVMGSSGSYRQLICRISRATGLRVLSVDYRLAPEHPFPAPIYDAYIAFKHLVCQGFRPEAIVVIGDSAGGHLSLALTHLLRLAGGALPGGLALLSPVTDMARDRPSAEANRNFDYLAKQPVESPLANARLFYAPGRRLSPQMRRELADPLVSPVNGDFDGFPPTLIQAGACEVLVDDSTGLHAAIAAQSPTRPPVLELYEDMVHVFQAFSARPESAQAIASIGRFVKDL
ncbi:hypothetical protein H4S01_005592, partial [Coemansia sp. RSA 2610]